MRGVYCKRRKNERARKTEEVNRRGEKEGQRERFCVIERCKWSYKVRGGKKECEVDVVSKIERKGETEREARQLGAPTDTHFCLSSFPLRAGSRRVTAGLHFWQTRGSSSLTKPCTTPP